ncbi:MAG: hypothetical protein RL693_1870 [Verrucomicrobiota bacterium]|jgi:UPF0176 protein
MPYFNVAGYKFIQLTDLPLLKTEMEHAGTRLELKGTILLAEEGINLFLCGTRKNVQEFLDQMKGDLRFADFTVKESWSETNAFRRYKVKLKKEIITMKHPTLRPGTGRAPAVDAPTLKRWLDQGHDDAGQPVKLLDTRNDYEVEEGTFRDAITLPITNFSEFPEALRQLPPELAESTVVSFCTGGIRCEKAALYMREQGYRNVLQLEGGILKYFEESGGDHYDGTCFVFDDRAALQPDLSPTARVLLSAAP